MILLIIVPIIAFICTIIIGRFTYDEDVRYEKRKTKIPKFEDSNEDTYYKDEKGEYYVISEEPPKFKDNLWNPIVYAEMEKVDYPVLEYQGELNE